MPCNLKIKNNSLADQLWKQYFIQYCSPTYITSLFQQKFVIYDCYSLSRYAHMSHLFKERSIVKLIKLVRKIFSL